MEACCWRSSSRQQTQPHFLQRRRHDGHSPGRRIPENQGFTLVWVGWQADLVAPTGVDLVTMSAPVAHSVGEDDPITGPVRAEFIISSPAPSLNILDDSSSNTPGYATAHSDTRATR